MKVDDLVQIIHPLGVQLTPQDLPYLGKCGTLTRALPDCHPECGRFWLVKLANGRDVEVAEKLLRLIPGDSEGRKVIDWNWRDLQVKTPRISARGITVELT